MPETNDSSPIENQIFPPDPAFSEASWVSSMDEYRRRYEASIADPDSFWAEEARTLAWRRPFSQVLDWSNPPFAKWFHDGELNVSENCLDRHIEQGKGDKVAIHWVGEPGDTRTLTYSELRSEVARLANVLLSRGVAAGDRVLIYMPMVPEAAAAMLACARIGAVHSVVFGGFSADSILDRLVDSDAVAVITADGGWRRGKIVPLKENVDTALQTFTGIHTCLVLRRCQNDVHMEPGRDLDYHDAMAQASDECPPVPLPSEHPLFILYTSGSTGKPKGILHSSGGYLTGASSTFRYVFDHKETDVYWCTADVGWVTGHSYIVYGPMANGATQVMYEGAPNHPDFGRFWDIVQEYKVTVFYTAPTAIRAFIKAGDDFPASRDLSSLRLLGTVGEPINPEAWLWYHRKIGGGRCPIVDTWWQTETGAIMITPLPGATPTKPGTATRPFFGIDAAVVDEKGDECQPNEGGKLVIRRPWPSMLRTIYKDEQRFIDTYWAEYAERGFYLAGDGARRDEDGYFWITGRLDDVLNVSGHRLGTAEVESALVAHESVAEAAVVGRPHEIKGQGIVAFVTLKAEFTPSDPLAAELRNHVGKAIGAIAKPDDIRFANSLPKTRSGKIMRRLLKELVATGQVQGDTTTLEDFGAIEELKAEQPE